MSAAVALVMVLTTILRFLLQKCHDLWLWESGRHFQDSLLSWVSRLHVYVIYFLPVVVNSYFIMQYIIRSPSTLLLRWWAIPKDKFPAGVTFIATGPTYAPSTAPTYSPNALCAQTMLVGSAFQSVFPSSIFFFNNNVALLRFLEGRMMGAAQSLDMQVCAFNQLIEGKPHFNDNLILCCVTRRPNTV